MCGRFDLSASLSELREEFGGIPSHDYVASYNVAPSQQVLTIREEPGIGRVWRMLRWGLIPHWAKDEKIGYKMINARAETIDEKPSFRESFTSHRCLIPASGFFEWKDEGDHKQPQRITRQNGKPFGLAGIYASWKGPGGQPVESCAIVTTRPNKLMAPIHDRMPVILASDNFDAWLDPSNADTEQLKLLLKPCPNALLVAYPVSTKVNSPKNDRPDCIEPV